MQMFQEIEKESQQHARGLEEQDHATTTNEPASHSISPIPVNTHRDRRRGSISISRLGKNHDAKSDGVTSVAAQSPFYQNQIANMSNTSFASGASDLYDEHAYIEDHTQFTRMENIVGKHGLTKAVTSIFPRRLSRTKSASILTPMADVNLVISVSVQESTTASLATDPIQLGTTVTVSASGTKLHSKASRRTLSATPGAKWLSKARNAARNLGLGAKQSSVSQNIPS